MDELSSDTEVGPLGTRSVVIFKDLKPNYMLTDVISLELILPSETSSYNYDWVGLFPLGWTNLRQYLTFEWVSEGRPMSCNNKEETLVLSLKFHPQYHLFTVKENEYYQFVYVSRQIEVLDVSTPFTIESKNALSFPSSTNLSTVQERTLSELTCVSMTGDSQETLKQLISRNRTLEDEIEKLNNELESERTERKNLKDLLKYVSQRKKMSQTVLEDMIAALNERETVRIVHGRTEMVIRRVEKLERPKSMDNSYYTMESWSKTPIELQHPKLILMVPAFMKHLCRNIKRNLRSVGLPWNFSLPIKRNKEGAVKDLNLVQEGEELELCRKNCVGLENSKDNRLFHRLKFQTTRFLSFLSAMAYYEGRIVTLSDVAQLLKAGVYPSSTFWLTQWKLVRKIANFEEQNERNVQIKLIIPSSANDTEEEIEEGEEEEKKYQQKKEECSCLEKKNSLTDRLFSETKGMFPNINEMLDKLEKCKEHCDKLKRFSLDID